MKSKRRHELQTNELADQIGQWIEGIKPYTTLILVVVVGGVAILAAWYYLAASKEKKRAQAWRSYLRAGTDPQGNMVGELTAVADDFSDTMAGLWAAQTAADIESARGIRLLFTDRASAETSLTLAKSRYQEILNHEQASKVTMLTRRAHFGLAQTYEAQNELDDAREHYAVVAESAKGTALGRAAQQRLDKLELADTKSWYNWFERQKPIPRDLGTGGSSPLGSGLDLPASDLNVVPEQPTDDFLNSPAGGKPEQDGAPAESGTEGGTTSEPPATPKDTPAPPPPADGDAESKSGGSPPATAPPQPEGSQADSPPAEPAGK